MEIARHLQSAWQNDSFYMQTASRNAASVFESGIVGCMVARIIGVISPKDGAIYSASKRVFEIFIDSMENRFAKEFFMSDCDEDEKLEEILREMIKTFLADCLSMSFCSLVKTKSVRTFNTMGLQFAGLSLIIHFIIGKALNRLFPSPNPAP